MTRNQSCIQSWNKVADDIEDIHFVGPSGQQASSKQTAIQSGDWSREKSPMMAHEQCGKTRVSDFRTPTRVLRVNKESEFSSGKPFVLPPTDSDEKALSEDSDAARNEGNSAKGKRETGKTCLKFNLNQTTRCIVGAGCCPPCFAVLRSNRRKQAKHRTDGPGKRAILLNEH